jgi:hypothetical protein
MALASPGVQIKEVDLTATVQVADQNIGVVAIDAEKGPTDTVTYISSEKELVEIFGLPNDYNFESWFAANTVIQYGGVVAVIRPTGGNVALGLNNANIRKDGTVRTNLLIKNKDQFQTLEEGQKQFLFAARTAGKFNNGIKVAVIDHGADQIITLAGATSDYSQIKVATDSFSNGDYVKIGDEYFKITSGATSVTVGNSTVYQYSVDNAQLGSTQSVHSTGDTVTKWTFADNVLAAKSLAEPNTINEIEASEVTITLNNVTGLVAGDYLRIRRVPVGGTLGTTEEIVKVEVVDADTATVLVSRGQLGTTAITFDDDAITGNVDPADDETGAPTITVQKLDFAQASPTVTTSLGAAVPSVTFSGAVSGLVAGDLIKKQVGSTWVYGNIYKIDGANFYISLWDTSKRFTAGNVLYDSAGTVLSTVSAVLEDDVYATLEYAPNRRWVSLAPQPGTSVSTGSRGGRFDEFHIAVVDEGGLVSGTPYTVLETLTYVSKASDGRNSDGNSTFWKKAIEDNSRYVFAGDDDLATKLTETLALEYIDVDGNVQVGDGDLGEPSQNQVFRLFKNASGLPQLSYILNGGTNYDYSTPTKQNTITNQLATAYEFVRDPETFGDIDFLVPGKITETVAVKLIDIAESRRDCIATISPRRTDVINSESTTVKTDSIIGFFKTLPSTSFAIFDSGYKYIYDKYNDKYRYVPCAPDVAGLCISTTINSETWFSPAGYNRGNLRNAQKLAYSPKQAERDRLYVNRINPVVSFPGQGIVLFGDKTALASPSAFDRINVRRLFIELEKNIAAFSKFQLFELNDEITRSGFKSAVEPYLRGVQGRRGIYDFLVVCDSSNNTPDVIDRNEFNAEIYIKPARSINFITITFIATRTGVSFNELIN